MRIYKLLMNKKLLIISLLFIVSIFIVLIVIYVFQINNSTPRITYLQNIKVSSYNVPIQSQKDAINFFLNQEDVIKEINKEGMWWVKASRFDPQNFNNIWLIILGNGKGECASSYQCYMHIYDNGTIKSPLKCSDGWNCK